MKINQGMLGGEKGALIDFPTIEMIDCEVQHPVRLGELTNDLGTIGVGVVMQPNGSPRILLDVRHPDDTALGVILNGDLLRELIKMLADAHNAATIAQKASLESTRQ